jgi:PAS domain S-box-containing protein
MSKDPCDGISSVASPRPLQATQASPELSASIYRTLLETSPDAMIIVDSEGCITWVNEATARIYGRSGPADFLGQPLAPLVSPDDPSAARETLRLVAQEGETIRLECRFRPADGAVRYAAVHIGLAPGDHGTHDGFVATVRDVTESHRAKDALEASREMLQQVLDTIPVRVFWKDRNLEYLGCNLLLARDAGLERAADIVGRTDYDLAYREQAAIYRADDREVIESGIPKINYEEPQSGADGRLRWLRTSKIPLRDPQGNIIGVLGTYDDITAEREAALDRERRNRALSEANEELRRIHRVKDEFVAMVSHELRTPLVTGIGYLELLLDGRLGELPERAQDRLQVAHRNLLRLSSIIQNLLSYQSVIKPGAHTTLGIGAVAPAPVLRDCASDFKVRQRDAAQRLETAFDLNLPPVLADEELLRVVLSNLLDNAARHAGSQAHIRLLARRVEDGVEMVVQDDGRGMEPELMASAFEPFVKSSESHGGSGLGLAIAQGILRAHDARLSLESAPGEGTAIRFVLPVASQDPAPRPVGEKALTPVLGVPASGRIAVVEDDADTREFLRIALLKRGFTVVEASSAEEALRTIDFRNVDLCLLDYSLPGEDGCAFCRELRAESDRKTLPVLMLSARAEQSARAAAEAAGCDAYLLKPLSLDTLVREITAALERS